MESHRAVAYLNRSSRRSAPLCGALKDGCWANPLRSQAARVVPITADYAEAVPDRQ